MSDVNVTAPSDPVPSILDTARAAVIDAAGKTGAVIKCYADVITSVFGAQWWTLKGKEARGIKGERAKFVEAFTNAGYAKGTVDVYWQRVKEAAGYVTTGNRVKGSTDVDGKTVAELKTIINRILKAEEDGQDPEASGVKGLLIEAFETLGGDPDTLG